MNILIIPSAKLVNEELQTQFGDIPSVLVPFHDRALIEHIYLKYKKFVNKIYIVGFEKSESIVRHIKAKNLDIELVVLDKLEDLAYSLFYTLNNIENLNEIKSLIINFGDTFVEEEFELDKDMVFFSKTDDSKRWTTFEFKETKIINIYNKEIAPFQEKYNSFVGLFNITNVSKFKEILVKQILNSKEEMSNDRFYQAILEYNKTCNYEIICTNKWFDLGHLDKYYNTKKDVKARYFNTIEVDKVRGILTKRSEKKEKFISEIQWYLKLPVDLAYLSPRIFNYSLNYSNPYIKMEYYSYNTLHDIYLYGEHTLDQWKCIFNSIELIIKDMKKYTVSCTKEIINSTLNEMYVNKTRDRLKELEKYPNFKSFFSNNIVINQKVYKSLSYYMEALPRLLHNYGIYNLNGFNIIHGDFCFSNILYDLECNILRLVDPRGQFGEFDIYGDTRYDLAKLSHSIEGKYDFIIADLFELKVNNNNIEFKIFDSERHKKIEELYLKKLESLTFDKNAIKLIEALLFLSMVPLHKDYPRRQYVMMATGIKLIHELVEGEK